MLPTLRSRALGAPHRDATPSAAARDGDLPPRLAPAGELAGHRGCVNACEWLADDATCLVTGSDDKTVRVWCLPTRRETLRVRTGHTNNVFQAKFVRGGSPVLYTSAADGEVRVFDIGPAGPAPSRARVLFRHAGRAHKIALAPGEPTVLFSVGEDGVLATLDTRSPRACVARAAAVAAVDGARARDRGAAAAALELYAVAVDPGRPHLVAIGGESLLARVLDRRTGDDVADYAPSHLARLPPSARRSLFSITGASYDATGLLASINRENVYLIPSAMARGESPRAPAPAVGDLPPSSDDSDDDDGNAQPSSSTSWFNERAPGDDAAPDPDGVRRFSGALNVRTVKGASFVGERGDHVACGSDNSAFYVWRTRDSSLRAIVRGADNDVVNIVASAPGGSFMLATSGIDDTIKLYAPTGDRAPLPDAAAAAQAAADAAARDPYAEFALMLEGMRGELVDGVTDDDDDDDGSAGSGPETEYDDDDDGVENGGETRVLVQPVGRPASTSEESEDE